MFRIHFTSIVMVTLLCLVPLSRAHEPRCDPSKQHSAETDKKHDKLIRLIEFKKNTKLPHSKSAIVKPVVIENQEELAKEIELESLRQQIEAEVDFKKQNVLYFAWSGSGRDQLTSEVTRAKEDPAQVRINYKRGRTRDLRPHVVLFAVNKRVKWKVQNVR